MNDRQDNGLGTDAGDVESGCGTQGGTRSPHNPPPSARRRGGGQVANANAVSHGLYAVGLPKGAQRVARRVNAFRRSLCAAVEERGNIGLWEAAQIDTACHWLRHGLLAARWLRTEHDKLSPADRLAFSREVARAAAERDKAIERLRLDKPPDPWAMLESPAVATAQAAPAAIASQPGPNAHPMPTDASGAIVARLN